jgi:hypothetical protein
MRNLDVCRELKMARRAAIDAREDMVPMMYEVL